MLPGRGRAAGAENSLAGSAVGCAGEAFARWQDPLFRWQDRESYPGTVPHPILPMNSLGFLRIPYKYPTLVHYLLGLEYIRLGLE